MAVKFKENNFVDRYSERFQLDIDEDWSFRQARLDILHKFLNGTIYDNLQPFWREYNSSADTGKYVPLAQRRPSVIYRVPKIIVDSAVSMLFGEGHFPVPRCDHEDTTQFLQYITRVCNLKRTMIDAARKGSIGSVVVLIKVLEGKFYFEALDTVHLMPVFNVYSPDDLAKLVERRKVDGSTLREQGYSVKDDDLKELFFIVREWNENEEIYYEPYKVEKKDNPQFTPVRDDIRSTTHGIGFVPAVWIKNLPKGSHIDGHSTFEDILDICIEMDYQLSQHGRLLKYNADPTLVIKNPSDLSGTELVKGIGTLNLDEKGDAFLLEITTGATKSVIEYVKALREIALETVRGNRGSPDKMHSAQSGEALKMLNFELVSLVDEMRITYGDYGLQKIYCMVLQMVLSGGLEFNFDKDVPMPSEGCEGHIMLDWGAWYTPTEMDKYQQSQTLQILTSNSLMSRRTAVETIADEYNVLDVDAELADIEKHEEEMHTKEAELKSANKKDSVEPKPSKRDAKKE